MQSQLHLHIPKYGGLYMPLGLLWLFDKKMATINMSKFMFEYLKFCNVRFHNQKFDSI